MKKILLITLLAITLSACDNSQAKTETPQRSNITIADIVNRDKIKDSEKLKLISEINPQEQYAIGVITSLTPENNRKDLAQRTVGSVVDEYEKATGEKIENGKMEYANDLRFKELQITSALILYTQTIPKEDQVLVKEYMARRLFKPEEMQKARNETISELIKKARTEDIKIKENPVK